MFWDTHLLVYLFEDFGPLSERVRVVRRKMLDRGDQLLTSTFTLGELLEKPVERGAADLCNRYEQALVKSAILLPFDLKAATQYARLRCDRSLQPPDAIQLACAGAARVDLFSTNDERVVKKRVEGIQFVTSLLGATL
ncbi:MAG TPA: PIN domain-containing protein [Verrucomicrobiae bacterium]|nr:PIN domain-containing protein [Verrucomicrobiae bacterium]